MLQAARLMAAAATSTVRARAASVKPCHHAADEHGASEGGDGEAMPRASGGGSGRDAAGDEADGGGGDEHGASEGGDGTARCQLL